MVRPEGVGPFFMEIVMAYRKKISKGRSRRMFRKTASRTHKRNVSTRPRRGGIRL